MPCQATSLVPSRKLIQAWVSRSDRNFLHAQAAYAFHHRAAGRALRPRHGGAPNARWLYVAGQVAADTSADCAGQTRQILNQIDALLAQGGSDKTRILWANVWLVDMADYAAMNGEWEAWVPKGQAPARATVEAKLAMPQFKVEIACVASAAAARARTVSLPIFKMSGAGMRLSTRLFMSAVSIIFWIASASARVWPMQIGSPDWSSPP
ncbi:MAG: RidA family protein [Rhodospirillaceae bacterium]|nr:RidA family protein [Rhodospirillaceae bacterium]